MDRDMGHADRPGIQDDVDAVSDGPELTDEQLAQARPFAEVFPGFIRRTPSAVR